MRGPFSAPAVVLAQPNGGASVPVADSDFTIDTTSYTNPVTGSGKIATLVFPAETTAFAIAIEGDAFPRWCFAADPVNDDLTMGDGTFNPDGGNGAFMGITIQTNGTAALNVSGANAGMILGNVTASGRTVNSSQAPMALGSGATIFSDAVDPNGPVSGDVGDIFIRTNPGGPNQTIYRCTVAGAPGVAVWTGIL